MAGQSITFDFLTRGADSTAAGFRKVGDNTVLAAKGAKVLSDAIESLGKKEDRTAAESATLAKALRLTGDAEDRVAARAVLADAAVRKLDDAMKDAAKKPLIPEVISAPALAKLTEIKVRAEELKARFPEFTARIDTTAASLKLAALAAEAKATDDAISRGFGNAGSGGNNRSLLSRLGGLFGGGGGGAGGEAGGAASGGGGLPGGPLLALGAPAAALAAALTPGIVGLGIGGAVGGATIGGGLFGAAEGKKVTTADLATIKQITTALKTAIGQQKKDLTAALKDAQKQYEKDSAFFAPFAGFQASLQGLAKTLLVPLRTVMAPLAAMFTQFGKGLTALGPQFAALFKASLPFIQQFLSFMLQAGKVLLPAFTQAMQQMVKSGALKTMSDSLLIIVKGLAGFITALGPGMASSATIFKGIATIIAAVLRGLGLAFAYMANTFLGNMHSIRVTWDALTRFLAGSFDITRRQITAALHTISAVWNATWNTLKAAFRSFVVNGILGPLGLIVHGAAAAFGWIPGLGSKLQGAAKAFDVFKANVNASLGGINGRTVNVSVAMTSKTNPYPGGISGRAASGLYIDQGTGPTADDVLIRASKGELIVPANMVKSGAVDHLRGAIPGFAGGGVVVSAHTPSASSVESTLMASVNTLAAAFAKSAQTAAAAAGGGPGGPGGGSGVARWAGVILQALSLLGQPASWLNTVERRMQQESGGNPTIVNKWDSNWLAGHPSVGLMQVIAGTFASYAGQFRNTGPFEYGVSVNPLANTYAGLHYALGRYGSLSALNRPGGYAKGGLVPGYASGGTVARQGAAWLKAWKSRSGGGFGAAWGPKVLNEQIPEMAAAMRRAQTLAGARGLSPGQHRFWASAAADEKKRLGVLGRELTTERAWRTQLGINELGLDKQIRAAGNLPSLRKNVAGWKAQMGRDKATVTGISKMLGYSDAYIKAHPAAKPGPVLPKITHTYGGDVANNIGAVLSAALGPFTGAARGGMVFDRGGTLRPGYNRDLEYDRQTRTPCARPRRRWREVAGRVGRRERRRRPGEVDPQERPRPGRHRAGRGRARLRVPVSRLAQP